MCHLFRRSSWLGGKRRGGVKFKRRGATATQHGEPQPFANLATAHAIVQLRIPICMPPSGWTLFLCNLVARVRLGSQVKHPSLSSDACTWAGHAGCNLCIRSQLKNNHLIKKTYVCIYIFPCASNINTNILPHNICSFFSCPNIGQWPRRKTGAHASKIPESCRVLRIVGGFVSLSL